MVACRSRLPSYSLCNPRDNAGFIADLSIKWNLIGTDWWSYVIPEPITVVKDRRSSLIGQTWSYTHPYSWGRR